MKKNDDILEKKRKLDILIHILEEQKNVKEYNQLKNSVDVLLYLEINNELKEEFNKKNKVINSNTFLIAKKLNELKTNKNILRYHELEQKADVETYIRLLKDREEIIKSFIRK